MEVLGENCKEFEEIKLVTIFKEYDGVVDEISNCDDEIVVILGIIFVDEIKKRVDSGEVVIIFSIEVEYVIDIFSSEL